MADIRPFAGIRPREDLVSEIGALPYDVYDRAEAKRAVAGKPLSFLNIDRPETQFLETQDMYAPEVYQKAHDLLWDMVEKGQFVREDRPVFYLYELEMDGRVQTGIVACASIDDYQNGVIKKHENTREEKEMDRIAHVDICEAQTGPIFLAYRDSEAMQKLVQSVRQQPMLFAYTAEDGITHRGWKIEEPQLVDAIQKQFANMPHLYIADGHHRAASAVKVGLKRRKEHPDYTGQESFNYFLSVSFPDSELMILDYNRVVKDLNGNSKEAFLKKASDVFVISLSKQPVSPEKKGEVGMFLGEQWYRMTLKPEYFSEDPVKGLDVSLLQEYLLNPVLGIKDPKTDSRIDFVGGIRGLSELERRVREGAAVAFSMYPTKIQELFAVADANLLMPPKSTWFEPKLRSGLFIHSIKE